MKHCSQPKQFSVNPLKLHKPLAQVTIKTVSVRPVKAILNLSIKVFKTFYTYKLINHAFLIKLFAEVMSGINLR